MTPDQTPPNAGQPAVPQGTNPQGQAPQGPDVPPRPAGAPPAPAPNQNAPQAAKDADKVAADKLQQQQRLAAEQQNTAEVRIVGQPGGPFSIDGADFGQPGELLIGGVRIDVTRWNDNSIKGVLPRGIKGDVLLKTSTGVRRGTYPPKPIVATTTTTTTVTTQTK